MKPESYRIIISDKSGRLGNRLFVFAHFIAFGAEHNIEIWNPAFHEYADYFETTHQMNVCGFPSSRESGPLSPKNVYRLSHITANLLHILKIQNTVFCSTRISLKQRIDLETSSPAPARYHFVQGWLFRAPGLVVQHQDLIRKYFKPLRSYQDRVALLIENVTSNCDVLIGVHIRQEDYKVWEGGKYYYTLPQYSDLMKRVEELFSGKRVTFLICSNEKLSQDAFPNLSTQPGPGHELEDLYCLASCRYLIGPPSTYTLWASFYGKVPLYSVEEIEKTPRITDFVVSPG